jgi:hypothetical protein
MLPPYTLMICSAIPHNTVRSSSSSSSSLIAVLVPVFVDLVVMVRRLINPKLPLPLSMLSLAPLLWLIVVELWCLLQNILQVRCVFQVRLLQLPIALELRRFCHATAIIGAFVFHGHKQNR